MRHDPGLAASPPVRYMLKMAGSADLLAISISGTSAGVCAAAARVRRLGEAGYRLGSDRGSPNHGNTAASKRVMAQT